MTKGRNMSHPVWTDGVAGVGGMDEGVESREGGI